METALALPLPPFRGIFRSYGAHTERLPRFIGGPTILRSPDNESGRYERDQRSFHMRKFRTATRTTKFVVAAVVASIVFAATYGFAASLGLTSSGLGAGNAVVAACGTGINAAYTTAYSATLPGYSV